jgi:hypothetical protein
VKKTKNNKNLGKTDKKKYNIEPEITRELDKVKDKMESEESHWITRLALKVLCGILIGVGAVGYILYTIIDMFFL